MLTQVQSQQFANDYQTVVDNVLKEHYQMYILDELYKSSFAKNLIFKGGTALRLAYDSFRFSEDLDFSLLEEVDYTDFKKTIEVISNKFSESKIKDIYDKYNTLFVKIVFVVDYKPIPIGIKIEVNKYYEKQSFGKEVRMLKSPFNNLELVASVFTLEAILKDKMEILTTVARRQPRDLFDAWYISQKLGIDFEIKDNYKYPISELMNGLNPLLPKKYQNTMDLFKL